MNDMTHKKFPKITQEGLDDLRQRIGVKIENTVEPWCYEATRDNIRHYAHGIGDDNPLWCDPAYAKTTKYGDVIALPSFLFATNRIISGYVGGLPGVHAMWSGANWNWHKPIARNTEFRTVAHLKDLIEHDTRFGLCWLFAFWFRMRRGYSLICARIRYYSIESLLSDS